MKDFYYRMVDDGTYCITGYEGNESEVVIPTDKVFTILSDKVFRGHSPFSHEVLKASSYTSHLSE